MFYSKKFMITIIIITTIQAPMQSAFKRTTSSFTYITEPLRPVIKGHIQRLHDLPIMQQTREHLTSARYALEKMHEPFRHPIYTELIEPPYIAHKARIWYQNMQDQWNNAMMNEHEKFTNNTYLKLKRIVDVNPSPEHQAAINEYEKAYVNYRKNPYNLKIHKELLTQTQRIDDLITRHEAQQQKSLRDHIFDAIYR